MALPAFDDAWRGKQRISYRYFSKILGPIAPDVPHHYFP
jgi:hypothetical protein